MTAALLTIFDFDGTLCDSRPAIVASLTSLLQEAGGEVALEEAIDARVREGRGLHSTLRALLPDGDRRPVAEIEHWAARYRRLYDTPEGEGGQPYPGAVNAVRAAALLGPVAVVSMKGHELLGRMVSELGLSDAVAAHFGDDDRRPIKPDAALFHRHIVPTLPAFSRGVMIGDTLKDLMFGRNCRLLTVHAAYGYGDPAECAASGPDYSVATPAEIVPLLRHVADEHATEIP